MDAKRTLASDSDLPPGERAYWVVPRWFLAGAYPSTADATARRERIRPIWESGARTFVNLVEEDEMAFGKPFALYAEHLDELAHATAGRPRASCLRFPILDGGIPTPSLMRSVLDAIDLSLDAGRPVYLHCWGGMGRTATTVGCWLLRHGLATPDDVFDTITRLRRADTLRRDRAAPENETQRAFVRAWARSS